jgi:ribosomal protein S18 acetylase RimI-like enzyme
MKEHVDPIPVFIQSLTDEEREWAAQFIRIRWGASAVVAHGNIYYPHTLPGFVARLSESERGGFREGARSEGKEISDDRVGLLTYRVADGDLEIVSIDSLHPERGIGTALIGAATREARDRSCRRIWLITTNDNLNALRFYQKRGFALVAIHRNALERSRALKPDIPLVGEYGIPLRDEIELEYLL